MTTRTERVVLELDDQFTSQMARAAAATAALRQELDGLNGAGRRVNSSTTTTNINNMNRGANEASGSINQLTGRLGLLGDALLTLGPGLIPIGAVGAQALGGLTAAATAAAIAGGSAIVAFQGVGDAVKALQEYQDDKTFANLEKAREAMRNLGPDAANFVLEFQKFRPVLGDIKDAAAAGWFPGLTESLEGFARLGPKIEDIFFKAGEVGGFLTEQAAESLASERWTPFLDFLEDEVPTAMGSLMQIMGDLTHGAAEMFMAFDPGNDRFLDWLEGVAEGFDSWASSSEGRESIQDFLDYARESGPAVAELFSSLVGALAAVVKAGAPIGQVVLPALSAVADLIKTIADSDMATPIIGAIAAMRIYSRVTAVAAVAQSRLISSQAAAAGAGTMSAANRAALNSSGLAGTPLGAALAAPRPGSTPTRAQRFNGAVGGFATVAGLLVATAAVSKAASANNELVDSLANVQSAIDSLDFASMSTAFDAADASLSKFKAKVESGKGFGSLKDPGSLLANTKNEIEGIFGDSDIEDSEKELAGLEAQMQASQAAAADLGKAMGMTIGPLDGSTRSAMELQAALEAAKPAMDALGISQADYLDVARQQAAIDNGGLSGAITSAALGATPIDDLNAQIADQAKHMDSAQGRSDNYVAALGRLVREEGTAAERAKGLNDALSALIDPANNAEAALDNYRAALKSIKELDAKGGFTDKTEAGRTNRAETRDLADSVKQRLVTMAEAGRTEEQVATALSKSREEFIKAGLAAGFNADQMKRRATAIGLTPKLVETTFTALGITKADRAVMALREQYRNLPKDLKTRIRNEGIPKSMSEARALADRLDLTAKERKALMRLVVEGKSDVAAAKSLMDSLHDKSVTLTTRHVAEFSTRRTNARVAEGSVGSADGGTVPKTGQSYADRHPYLLADGEEVISNRYGQADRNRTLLKAINAGRLAGGGTAGASPWGGVRSNNGGIDFGDINTFAIVIGRVGSSLKAMRKELEESTSALQKEKALRSSLIDTVRNNFKSDPFAKPNDIWSQGGSPIEALLGDIGNLREFQKTIKALGKRGLDGAALAEADTLEEAQALASLSPAELKRYEILYNQRNRLATSVGGTYADLSGASLVEIKGLRADVRRLERTVKAEEKKNRDNRDQNSDKKKAGDRDRARSSAQRMERNAW